MTTGTWRSMAVAATIAAGTGGFASGQCVEDCSVIHTFVGEAAGDQFGWVSNDLDDIDGDGVRDLVITAPTNDAGGGNAGRIYVYSGLTGNELWHATGPVPGGWLGHDAGCAGEMTGDGIPDIVAGGQLNGAGRAIVYSGADGSVFRTLNGESAGDQFGFRVHGGGDFDGDGQDDLIVGAPLHDTNGADAGRVYVYKGPDLTTTICTIDGFSAGINFGSGVAFVGDTNFPPDGRDDIMIGARNFFPGGRAFVFSWDGDSCVFRYQLNPGSPSTNFGQWFMNGGHDVNGDGTPDLYVNDFGVNRAHVFSGRNGSLLHTLDGEGEGGGFGIGRLVPDLNGDDRADLLLAAWVSSVGGSQAGKAFVYSGVNTSIFETFTHDVPGAGFGFDANWMGDVDGDGKDDHLITAAQDNANGGRGIAYLLAGTVPPVDYNGDGTVDVNDLVVLIVNWGPCTDDSPCAGDGNKDGVVDVNDLVFTILNWG